MRLLFISQYYDPEPVPKISFLARNFAKAGHQVTVLTSLPCYPEGKIYRDYRGRSFLTEKLEGMEILRVPQIPDHSSSAWRRIVYYFSFPFFAAFRILSMAGRKYDVVYFYGAAIPVLGLAPLVRLVFGARTVFDVVDLWPESVEASGMLRNKFLLRIVSWFSTFLYKRADFLCLATNGFRNRLMERGIAPSRMKVAYCVNLEDVPDPVFATEDGNFTLAYTGGIGVPQDLDVLLEAAKILKASDVQFKFLIAGAGTELERLRKRAQGEGLTNIQFLGRLPSTEMPSIYARADALLVHLKPDSLSTVSIPSKTYSYMAAGKPIVMAVDGEAGEFVERNQCGLKVKAGDPRALADALLRLAQMPDRMALGKNGRRLFEQNFTAGSQLQLWEDIFKNYVVRAS